MKKLLLFSLLVLFSCSTPMTEEVLVVKQWHLLPGINTSNISEAKNLPQYTNQKDIYDYLYNLIDDKKIDTVISEGCEGEINDKSTLSFNSWNFQKLSDVKTKDEFSDILSLVPLKLKVKFGKKLNVLCGDSNELISKHQLALSNIRGYYGFYLRFSQFKGKEKGKYKKYLDSLEAIEKRKVKDPVAYTKKKILAAVDDYNKLIDERNDAFLKVIKENYKTKNIAVVVGGMHADDILSKLKAENIKTVTYTPKGYDEKSEAIIKDIVADLK